MKPSKNTEAYERPSEPESADVASLTVSPAASQFDAGAILGRCVDSAHPTLVGRVLIEMSTPEGCSLQRWLPCLVGLSVRAGDHVLVTKPINAAEPVVIGVVDGFSDRPNPARHPAAAISLQPDEALVIECSNGRPLLELSQGSAGPVARILHDDLVLELPGALRVSATAITLEARAGEARISASADVVVTGETIQLN